MFETLKGILVGKLKVAEEVITPEATIDDIELDSLALVELALLIEQEVGVSVDEEELAGARTVDDITQLMSEQNSSAA
ncbi:acyl carrier protein [Streptomyces sp. NPDC060006]|uniref:acyl carrier protein n=1 Tax=unclassified Streptomyces TaxID=2593676 RepID=UPI003636BB36